VELAILSDPDEQEKVWKVREAGLGASAFVPGQPDAFEGWEDSAAPPDRLGDYLRALRSLFEDYGYKGTYYGHFGDGCVHTRITFDMYSADGVRKFRSFVEDAADLVISFGGSMSGEHGDGQSRAELLSRMFGDELVQAFREFKAIWDPDNRMNPGKVVEPYRIDENLRLGADYHPRVPDTHFTFRSEGGNFERAANRCVGIGLCRKEDSEVMCPSYMVTREEMHSTRGRARLLFEMLQGDPVSGGWRDRHVKEALDLCLACKGCKSECPVNVDMATYKAEFYSHFYRRRLRPRVAYAMGLIYWWARAASKVPRIANFLIGAPVVSRIFKTAGGIAPERNAPSFATVKFRRWFRDRGAVNAGGTKVVLWPDTFNAFFHVEVAKAAVEVLEGLGYSVTLPDRVLCCGRPLYDFGMLPTAKRLLRRTMDELGEEVAAGTAIVGIEPSCVAVFRDELANLFSDDARAHHLATNFLTLGEFVARHGQMPWSLKAKALMHPHCHHTSVMGVDADMSVLESLGIDVEETDAGCCGLAGSFGYEAGEKYEVSVKAGERKLAPLIRGTPDTTLIVTDGFSCRTQIEHLTGRRALHLAEVLRMAMDPTSRSG
jgi:Fe-S oxidoreductase